MAGRRSIIPIKVVVQQVERSLMVEQLVKLGPSGQGGRRQRKTSAR
jgi:hypothetical protein